MTSDQGELPEFRPGRNLHTYSAAEWQNLRMLAERGANITGVYPIQVARGPSGTSISIASLPRPTPPPPRTIDRKFVVLREIPDPEDRTLMVEEAVGHQDYAGDEDPANRYRLVPLSEYDEAEPKLIAMSTWPHWPAWVYDTFRWPIVTPPNTTTFATHILQAHLLSIGKGRAGWFVEVDPRLAYRRVAENARFGGCQPIQQSGEF